MASIAGAVNHPKQVALTHELRIYDLISLAGGLNEKAGGVIQLIHTRPEDSYETIDIRDLVRKPELNRVVRDGDFINVPESGIFYVSGNVNKPGAYPLKETVPVRRTSYERHGGTYALHLAFTASMNSEFNHIAQLVAVEPGQRYRLSYFVKMRNVTTNPDRAPFIELAEILLLLLAVTFGRKWINREERREGVGKRLLILAVLAAVAVIAFWLRFDKIVQRLNATRAGASEFSVVTRIEYWQASWQMFLDHPVGGVGLGAFPAVYPGYGRSTAKYERLEQAHNDYLQLLTDAGLIGAALGGWFLFEIVRIARRQLKKIKNARSRARAIIAGGYTAVTGLLIHSFTDFNLQIASNALLFLFVIALTTSITMNTSHSHGSANCPVCAAW